MTVNTNKFIAAITLTKMLLLPVGINITEKPETNKTRVKMEIGP